MQESAGESCVRGSTQIGAAAPHTHWQRAGAQEEPHWAAAAAAFPAAAEFLQEQQQPLEAK